ncbi:MAG: S41 family peptidase [Tissierella sp.]|nr:S41 family peptidase [Tissierella sp.]
MWNKNKISLISLILLIIILATPLQSYAQVQELDNEYYQEVLDLVQNRYVNEIPSEGLGDSLDELFNKLDKHSDYFTEEEFAKFNEDLEGNFVGIGAYIREENNYIKVVRPINGSPAEKAGLLPDDIIISVDAKSVKGMSADQAVDLIKGEIGTVAKLRVRSKHYTKVISVTRDHVVVDPVQYQVIDDIGYIILERFNNNSYFKMLDVLEYLEDQNIHKIILDLRDNPGGYLDEVVDIAGKFVPKGPVVHIKYGENDIETHNSKLEETKYELVVLVNARSASASEILAGAIKDTEVGTLVGVTTYGKGTVQEVVTLPRGDGIKLTIAEYFSPNMNKIDGIGIIPDIVVENQPNEDTQLKTALELLAD